MRQTAYRSSSRGVNYRPILWTKDFDGETAARQRAEREPLERIDTVAWRAIADLPALRSCVATSRRGVAPGLRDRILPFLREAALLGRLGLDRGAPVVDRVAQARRGARANHGKVKVA